MNPNNVCCSKIACCSAPRSCGPSVPPASGRSASPVARRCFDFEACHGAVPGAIANSTKKSPDTKSVERFLLDLGITELRARSVTINRLNQYICIIDFLSETCESCLL